MAAFRTYCCLSVIGIILDLAAFHRRFTVKAIALARNGDPASVVRAVGVQLF